MAEVHPRMAQAFAILRSQNALADRERPELEETYRRVIDVLAVVSFPKTIGRRHGPWYGFDPVEISPKETRMLTAYIEAAMHKARYEILPEEGSFYGEIAECNGVFANADTLETCRDQLQEVLEDWILIRTRKGLPLPTIGGIELSVQDVA